MTTEHAGRQRLERSRQELAAARHLVAGGFLSQAMSRAYYATFYAAEEALFAIGETRSKHSGVISAFGHLIVREGGVGQDLGLLLRFLFERRNEADYELKSVPLEEAEKGVEDAQRLVDAVESWLSSREAEA